MGVKIKSYSDLWRRTNASDYIYYNDLVKAHQYKDNITYNRNQTIENNVQEFKSYLFTVANRTVSVSIDKNKKIIDTDCSCKDYTLYGSCEHIAGVLFYENELLFNDSWNSNIVEVSTALINKFKPSTRNIIKKEITIELTLKKDEYSGNYNVKATIGETKQYNLENHLRQFKIVYLKQGGNFKFGKDFTYEPKKQYMSEASLKKLKFLFNIDESYGCVIRPNKLKQCFDELKDLTFICDDYVIKGIKEEFPVKTELIKDENNLILKIDYENIYNMTDDFEYIMYQGQIYHLKPKERELLTELDNNYIDELVIKEENIESFKKGLLGVIKKNIKISSTVENFTIPKDVTCELYFDIRNTLVTVLPVFIYDYEKVEYFDKKSTVIRDTTYEVNTINDLVNYGFNIEKNKIFLNNIEKQVEFIETGLEELANNYVVFTTEKFKAVNIRKKLNINSTFSIGQDNILKFGFDLGDINSEELVNIFKEIKTKKKYYRLKNGDILNLEDKSLNQLQDLSEDLELTDEEIINGKGSIQKYRAIYLDSVKKNKYDIINTDNLFDNFIDNFYKYKDADLTLEKRDLKTLRDYQLIGVKWLYNLHKTNFGGILADEMGLGKTIQTIYYIKQVLKDEPGSKFLIVVPTSLSYNWEHEFNEFGKKVKVLISVGQKILRKKELENADKYDVIVTTYGLLREDEELYSKMNFNTMIIDEAQNIKNNMAGITRCVKSMKTDTRFALTGTPLENSVLELWSIFDFIMPGYLSSLLKFQSKYKIRDLTDENTNQLLSGLNYQINPFMLRRKKEDVTKELPEKLLNDVYIDLCDEQKKLYAAELERVKKEMKEIMATDGISKARFMILQLLTKLRQICIDPGIVYEDYTGGSNKLDILTNITKEYIENNHKILIFSSFRTALNLIKKRLEDEGIKTFIIDGSVSSKKRQEQVDEFNSDNSRANVFLIMLKSGGTGLNLTGADVVIHMDLWWNPQAENQATDRAHRIGQTKTVEVMHLITKGTIEEKIFELQVKKKILSDKIIDGNTRDTNLISSLTESDIKHLLSYENKN